MTPNTVPIINGGGSWPTVTRRLFVNIAVADLQRSIRFFEALGFTFNRQLTDGSATCMLVGVDVYFMLLSTERFVRLSKRPLEDARRTTSVFYAFGMESRESVATLVSRALEYGGSPAADPQDQGYMYTWSFYDPDGHRFEVFWVDPTPFARKSTTARFVDRSKA